MAVTRPKPSFPRGKAGEPNAPFLGWLDRLLGDFLGDSTSLREAIQGMLDAIDLSAIEADITALQSDVSGLQTDVADHESRIDDLEAGGPVARTETIRGRLSIATSTTPIYFFPGSKQDLDTHDSVLANHQAMWGRAGTLTNFRLHILTSSGDADTATFSFNVNGSDSALSISGVSGTDTSTYYLDTSEVTVAATDLVCISRANGSGTGSWQDAVWSVDFITDP